MPAAANPLEQLLADAAWAAGPAVSVAVRRSPGAPTGTATVSCGPATVFQAASISKPVAALGTLILVDRGTLNLDDDVNDHLASWRLPIPAGWPAQVTLRHLLCHSGALSVEWFPGYLQGTDLPSLRQILDGEPPANTPPVRVSGLPGLSHRYSGGGYTVLQQLLEDVTGTAFSELMAELVLRPLGMSGAHYSPPGPDEAAPGYIEDEQVPGGWHVYPEQAAAGLWCTPSDLVKFAGAIQDMAAGRAREPGQPWPLRTATARLMLAGQFPGWGLGLQLGGAGSGRWFGHTGGNEGYACEASATVAPGPVIAIMTASHDGHQLISRLTPPLRQHLAWPDEEALKAGPEPDQRVSFAHLAGQVGRHAGDYTTGAGQVLRLAGHDWNWTLTVPGQPPLPLEPVTPDRLRSPVLPAELEFTEQAGRIVLTLRQPGDDGPEEIIATRV
jgi:CubicO group peptidase (beta-lactamase class C family)